MIKPDPRKRDVVPLTGWEIVIWLGECVKMMTLEPEPNPARAGA